ncbi:TIGR02679 domain-containing protein, partial [Lentzea sp.]|uniref:TIGR02679 domain-containing protein n=1 Tax=Lentzea sp. TaxID=56099 RepID=UPI002ECFCCA7
MADRVPAQARDYLVGLGPLWSSVRKRLEGNGLSPTGVIVVDLDYQAAETLSGLLGRTVSQGRSRIRLAELDAALRSSVIGHGLITVVAELTGGPLVDRKAASRAREVSRIDLWAFWERAVAESGLDAAPWVPTWRDGLRRTGLLIRVGDEAETVIRHAMAVLRTLARSVPLADRTPGAVADAVPVESAFELAELASAACGDAHALDAGQVTAAVVLRALAAATGTPSPTTAAARRELWSAVGVSPDAVSGTLLTWAVRPPGDDSWSA